MMTRRARFYPLIRCTHTCYSTMTPIGSAPLGDEPFRGTSQHSLRRRVQSVNDPHAASITRTRHRVCILSLLLLLGLQGVEAPLAESARLHKRSPVNPPASTCVLPKAQGQTQKISFSHSPHAKKFLPLCQLAGETYPAVFQYLDHLNTLYTLAKNESTLTPGNPALMFSE